MCIVYYLEKFLTVVERDWPLKGFVNILILLSLSIVVGCTSIEVAPIPVEENLKEISIKENPKVIVDDFLPFVEKEFHNRGIKTYKFKSSQEAPTPYILTYTALQTWDFTTYLSHAELKLEKNGRTVAAAVYHLRAKGGLSLMKWQGTETKMTPVLDELLQHYPLKE